MAEYIELYNLRNNDVLMHKIAVAAVIAADVIRSEAGDTPNHANRLIWAKAAFSGPVVMSQHVLWALLAANKDASVETITSASDATIQTAVDNVVDVFAGS